MKKILRIAAVSAITALAGVGGAWAEPNESLPEGLRGFSGQVRGVVVNKGEKNSFSFKVSSVLQVWKNNKAKTPESIVGRTIQVSPRWTKGGNDQWKPVENHVAFIHTLKPGQELTLEIRNEERAHFSILELSGEQRKAIGNQEESALRGTEKARDAERGKNAQIEELKAEIKRLKSENEELQRQRK